MSPERAPVPLELPKKKKGNKKGKKKKRKRPKFLSKTLALDTDAINDEFDVGGEHGKKHDISKELE